jgi:hypothetical protein
VPVPERARSVGRVGTAFAVSPQGYLVSAAHVVSPSAEELAASVYLQKLAIEGRPHSERGARAWVERTGARPTGVRLMLRTVRQADVSGDARRSRMLVPRVVAVDWGRDLVLLRVGLRDAPALALGAGRREGTRVATIGFGSDDPFSAPQRGELVPAVRKGALGSTGPVRGEPDRLLTRVSADVKRGDSGGPAVDQDGRVRGVVLVRLRAGGGAIAPSADITRLLARAVPQRPLAHGALRPAGRPGGPAGDDQELPGPQRRPARDQPGRGAAGGGAPDRGDAAPARGAPGRRRDGRPGLADLRRRAVAHGDRRARGERCGSASRLRSRPTSTASR